MLRIWCRDKRCGDREDAGSHQAEDGGQQGDGHEDGDGDGRGGGQGHGRQEGNVHNGERRQRDEHGQPSEHHGGTGFAYRQAREVSAVFSADLAKAGAELLRRKVMPVDVVDEFAAETREDK